MDAITLLTQRQSCGLLTAPAPSATELDVIYQAAQRVPDHGALNPWHIHQVSGAGLTKLSKLFEQALCDDETPEAKREKIKNMPFRAPMILVVSTKLQQHEKVPQLEQEICAGCVVHAMQMAAFAQGLGAMWRTGEAATQPVIKQAFGLAEGEAIVGFLYLGTPSKNSANKPQRSYAERISVFE